MKKWIERVVLYGSSLLILLGFVVNVWEPVVIGSASILLCFGIPHILGKVQDAIRR